MSYKRNEKNLIYLNRMFKFIPNKFYQLRVKTGTISMTGIHMIKNYVSSIISYNKNRPKCQV